MSIFDRKNIQERFLDLSDCETVDDIVKTCNIRRPLHNLSEIILMSDGYDAFLYTVRCETDEEYEARIKPYTDKIRKQEEKDRREYERLKAKFGSTK